MESWRKSADACACRRLPERGHRNETRGYLGRCQREAGDVVDELALVDRPDAEGDPWLVIDEHYRRVLDGELVRIPGYPTLFLIRSFAHCLNLLVSNLDSDVGLEFRRDTGADRRAS